MSAIFIIFLLFIAATTLAIYLSKRLLIDRPLVKRELDAPPPVSLFGGQGNELPIAIDDVQQLEKQRAELLARAANGDVSVLHEAHAAENETLYDAALDLLVTGCADDSECLRRLAAEVAAGGELRANRRLAEALIEDWKESPEGNLMAEMLHVAALSDDAALYEEAVNVALRFSCADNSRPMSGKDFCKLVESQFWVLSAQARASGAGFMLKERLAEIRRELAVSKREDS
ncbi:MAG: hypothetical protein H0V88_09435 [Pyrinomonadaceae bacterium]|nr:hypothetical protein [Pyrinomonadaceae bacterium]